MKDRAFARRRIRSGSYDMRLVGIHWISHTVFATSQYCMDTAPRFADHPQMCGRYVSPTEAAMERAYNLTGRQWQAWMAEAYKPSYNVAPSQRVPVLRVR